MAAPRPITSDEVEHPEAGDAHQTGAGGEPLRRRNWLLGLTPPTPGTPKGVPDVPTMADEVADLRRRLDEAERRAREAEMALPHLLGLGQRTVNGLLNDARERGRQIIEAARAQATEELDAQRTEVRRETRELDALRMAVAAEAMGLEEIRAELQRRISMSAVEIARVAAHPMLLGGEPLQLDQPGLDPALVAALAPPEAPLLTPTGPAELDGVIDHDDADVGIGVIEASVMQAMSVEAQIAIADAMETTATVLAPTGSAAAPSVKTPASNPSAGFADAWAEDEDEAVAEAFERFFSAEVDSEPSREWILADDTNP